MNRIDSLAEEMLAQRSKQGHVMLRVANVEEALSVAQLLRETGQAQWFRGQTQNWPKLTPSLYRGSDADVTLVQQAMQRLERWATATPGLEELAASTDALVAVAQHYGVPTAFIDFSTDPRVAAYFASVHPKPPPIGTESCIFCLDINEAARIWGVRPKVDPEIVVLDVPNLWRLEAQSGGFVFCRYDDLNLPFPLDRIVFPYTGPVSAPSDAEIYPERESPLESLLNEYLQGESIIKGSVVFEEINRHLKVAPQTFTFAAPPVMNEYFLAPTAPHASWTGPNVGDWLKVTRQVWTNVQDPPKLSFDTKLNADLDAEEVRFERAVRAALQSDAGLRQSKIEFKITVEECDPKGIEGLSKAMQRVWDEMARLPWTDAEIALALSAVLKCFVLAQSLKLGSNLTSRELERKTMAGIFDNPIRVELGGSGNAHTWAWVEEDDLHAAVRPDFESLLRPEHRGQILGDTFNTLMVSRTPSLLFDFGKLSDLFAKQMIPTQAVFYPDHPLFPTPARVQVIGPE